MAELVQQGKVRYLGLSAAGNHSPCSSRLSHFRASDRVFPLGREPEAEILPICRELGIGFVPHSPLGRGSSPAKFGVWMTCWRDYRAAIRAFRQRIYSRIWNSCSRLKKWQPRGGQTWTASAGLGLGPGRRQYRFPAPPHLPGREYRGSPDHAEPSGIRSDRSNATARNCSGDRYPDMSTVNR